MYGLISIVLLGQVCVAPTIYTQPVYVAPSPVYVAPVYVAPVCPVPADQIIFNGVIHTRSQVCANFRWGIETVPIINGCLPDVKHHRDICGNVVYRTYTYEKRINYCSLKYGIIVNYDAESSVNNTSPPPQPRQSTPPPQISPPSLIPVNPRVEQPSSSLMLDERRKIEPPLPFLRQEAQ